MNPIFNSATKISLLLFVITTCSGFLLGKFSADLFGAALMTVLGFYFGDRLTTKKEG